MAVQRTAGLLGTLPRLGLLTPHPNCTNHIISSCSIACTCSSAPGASQQHAVTSASCCSCTLGRCTFESCSPRVSCAASSRHVHSVLSSAPVTSHPARTSRHVIQPPCPHSLPMHWLLAHRKTRTSWSQLAVISNSPSDGHCANFTASR